MDLNTRTVSHMSLLELEAQVLSHYSGAEAAEEANEYHCFGLLLEGIQNDIKDPGGVQVEVANQKGHLLCLQKKDYRFVWPGMKLKGPCSSPDWARKDIRVTSILPKLLVAWSLISVLFDRKSQVPSTYCCFKGLLLDCRIPKLIEQGHKLCITLRLFPQQVVPAERLSDSATLETRRSTLATAGDCWSSCKAQGIRLLSQDLA